MKKCCCSVSCFCHDFVQYFKSPSVCVRPLMFVWVQALLFSDFPSLHFLWCKIFSLTKSELWEVSFCKLESRGPRMSWCNLGIRGSFMIRERSCHTYNKRQWQLQVRNWFKFSGHFWNWNTFFWSIHDIDMFLTILNFRAFQIAFTYVIIWT